MTLSRRNLLSLFGAAGASAASGVSAKDAVRALGGSGPLYPSNMPQPAPSGMSVAEPTPHQRAFGGVINRAYQRREAQQFREFHIPQRIMSKRSWSNAYKMHEAEKENREFRELLHRLEQDEGFATQVLKALGVTLDT